MRTAGADGHPAAQMGPSYQISFATHAGNCPTLSPVLRETFKDLYETYDPLQDIASNARAVLTEEGFKAVQMLPEQGGLDLSGLLAADYTFA